MPGHAVEEPLFDVDSLLARSRTRLRYNTPSNIRRVSLNFMDRDKTGQNSD